MDQNKYEVSAYKGYVVALQPLPQRLTREDAIALAARLILGAEQLDTNADAFHETAELVEAFR